MDVIERELKVIASEDATSAVEKWYESFRNVETRTRIRARLARVRSGNFGDHKIFSGGIGELRLDFGPGYRIYFVQSGMTTVILLAAGDKSTQDDNIREAQRLWEDAKDDIERLQRDLRL